MKNVQIVFAVPLMIVLIISFGVQCVCSEEGGSQSAGPSSPYTAINTTDLSGRALSGATGVIGVNMTAGDDNAQVNARTITLGQGGPAFSNISVLQKVDANVTSASPSLHCDYIGGQALTGSRGIVSINQASGSGSAQANLVSLGLGSGSDASLVSGNELLMSYAQTVINPVTPEYGERSDVISGNAFSGSHGLVQVNQSAGSANRVLNTMAIQFKVIDIQ